MKMLIDHLLRFELWSALGQYMGTGKRVRVIGRTGAPRSRAVIVASQVLFLDYDRAFIGLAEEPEAEEQLVEAGAQPEVEPLAQSKRGRRKQAA